MGDARRRDRPILAFEDAQVDEVAVKFDIISLEHVNTIGLAEV